MSRGETHSATDSKERLLLIELKQEKYGGYKQDLLENNLDGMEIDFCVCSKCNGVMRNACLVNGPDQIFICEVCKIGEDTIPMARARNNISKLRAKCPLKKRGCVWKGSLGEIDTHLDECAEFILSCPKICGVLLKRSELQNHCENECQLRIVKCEYCKATIQYKVLENHNKICLKFPLLCPNECLKNLIRKDLKLHIDEECPNTLVVCPYKEMGCEVLSKRSELQEHEKIFELKHFGLSKIFYLCQFKKMEIIILDQKDEIKLLSAKLLNIENYLESKNIKAPVTTLMTSKSRDTELKVDSKQAGKSIDEALYSRQLYVLGHEAMHKIQSTSVLICGMRAMGVEIAKNVILAGPRAVTLYDPSPAQEYELGCNFYLTRDKVGTERAAAVQDQLAELNSYVRISCLEGELTADALSNFQVVVLCDAGFSEQLRVGDICHQASIKFISVGSYGLFGSLFCDFGENFLVLDKNGEQPSSCFIHSISQAEEGVVRCHEDTRKHNMKDGDFVTFSEVCGMEALNSCKPQKIKFLTPYSFSISDTSKLPAYRSGGIATECKMPVTIHFKSLRRSLEEPDFLITDSAKCERPPQLLAAFQALDLFVSEKGQLPRPYNKEDAEQLVKLTERVYANSPGERLERLDRNLIEKLAFVCRGELMPMVSFLGGIAAQEVLKSCTGKFYPLRQFLFFDALECLPPDDQLPPPQHSDSPQADRYASQRLVFGGDFQRRLENLNYFVVGAGALGCELLKNFAMMGVGSGPGGKVVITDMDNIKRSNLNRQFLFRPWDIGKNKSLVAAAAAQKINPSLRIEAHVNKVGPVTDSFFDDKFFSKLNGVTSAMDNLNGRMYVKSWCVDYLLPLIECGNIGTKGNVQVVLPFLTESYSSSADPPERIIGEYEFRYLKYSPYTIEHMLRWAVDSFDRFFTKPGLLFRLFKEDSGFMGLVEIMPEEKLYYVLSELEQALSQRAVTFPDCVEWARIQFEVLFTNKIKQLLVIFPPDCTCGGTPYWSGAKRCPVPIIYDNSIELHLDFIEAASLLYAESHDLSSEGVTREQIQSLAARTPVFKPRKDMTIDALQEMNSKKLNSLIKEIQKTKLPDWFSLRALDFEKDDDSNHHIDFITSCSNLRATNYRIETADKYKSKGIAGNIIPAIATTTTAVVGLACLELYKLTRDYGCTKDKINLENYKNVFFNLAMPFFAFSEPILAEKKKCNETEFTFWDRFKIDGRKARGGEMTLGELISFFKEKYELKVTAICRGIDIIFCSLIKAKKGKALLLMPVSKAVEYVSKYPIPPYYSSLKLIMICEDKEGEEMDVPFVNYNFR